MDNLYIYIHSQNLADDGRTISRFGPRNYGLLDDKPTVMQQTPSHGGRTPSQAGHQTPMHNCSLPNS